MADSPYPSYASPKTQSTLKRSQYLSDYLKQNKPSREVYNSAMGTNLSMLSDAILAYGQNQQAKRGDRQLAADRTGLADMIMGGFKPKTAEPSPASAMPPPAPSGQPLPAMPQSQMAPPQDSADLASMVMPQAAPQQQPASAPIQTAPKGPRTGPQATPQEIALVKSLMSNPATFEQGQQLALQIQARGATPLPPTAPYNLGPNDKRFDGDNNMVASNMVAPKPDAPAAKDYVSEEFNGEVWMVNKNDPKDKYKLGSAKGAGADGAPDFSNENMLRNQYNNQAQNFTTVRDAFTRVRGVGKGETPAEQMSLIFGYMKMLDPGSTVREGEYATAQNTTGVPGMISNAYNKILEGKFLTPEQIKGFKDQAVSQYHKAEENYGRTYDFYRGMADRYKMSPGIIQDFRVPQDDLDPEVAQLLEEAKQEEAAQGQPISAPKPGGFSQWMGTAPKPAPKPVHDNADDLLAKWLPKGAR